MALFGNSGSNSSSNPTLSNRVFDSVRGNSVDGIMTIQGTIGKTAALLSMLFLAGTVAWYMVGTSPNLLMPFVWGGLIVGFILALIISFKPQTAPYLALVYAAAEGLFLGSISAMFNTMFAESMPGIVSTAVSITFLTAVILLFAYQTRIIKVTEKFRSVIIIATMSVLVFYVGQMILGLFGVNLSAVQGSGWLSIGISLVVVVIAALNLLLDFDFIEKQSQANAPKYMEWYGAFGLTVTLVWLYLEILKLLAKLADR